jgi:formylglycine-generating enzyme required for sulfatase activity
MAAHPRSFLAVVSIACVAFLCPFLGCSSDDGGTSPDDSTAPAAITDLIVQQTGASSVTVRWSAPGDDGATGQAATYDLRFMAGEASAYSWAGATAAAGLPAPQTAGTTQSYTIQGLTAGARYTFAIKTADERPNWSAISNLVSAQVGEGSTDCQVAPTSIDFGSVSVGSTADRSFTITNGGTQALSGTIGESCDPFSIVSGGGAFALAASETRTVTVRYAPTAAGSHSCTIDTGTQVCADVSCSGTATGTSSDCTVSPTTLMFPFTGVNYFELMTFYITNNSATDISGNVSSSCNTFEVMVGGGAFTLPAGQRLMVLVRFRPSAEGIYTCTIDTGLGDCDDVECSGTCGELPPGCTVNPTVLLYPDTPIGSTFDQEFTIANDTDGTISGNIASGNSTFSVINGGGPYTLQPAEMLTATVRYAPTTHGTHTGVIQTGLPCLDVGCAGTSVEINQDCFVYPVIILNYAKRFVGTWEEKTFFIQNLSTGTLTGTVGSCSPPFQIVTGAGSYSLALGQSHAVTVRYEPTSAGTHVCEVDTGSGCTNVACVGVALATDQPLCAVAPTSLTFPETGVGSTSDQTFTISNSGTGMLTGSVQEGCDVYSILSGGGSYALAAGQSRTVTVRYAPTSAGHHTCTIETGASLCSDVECDGTATGGSAECQVIPTALDFGETQVGGWNQRSFNIYNDGSQTFTGSVSGSCEGFTFITGGGPYSLGAGESRLVTVQFAPTAPGEATCDISTGTFCTPVHCTGTGIQDNPECAIDPESGLAFGQVLVGEQSELSFTITNTGTGALNGTIAPDCPPFVIAEGGGSYSLGPSESRAVTVRFVPQEVGEYTCSILTGSSCPNVVCTGTGMGVPPEDMVLVPAGTFTMGSDEEEGGTAEMPEHSPDLSAYYIDTYEVSNLKYAEALNWAMERSLIEVTGDSEPNGIAWNGPGTAGEAFLYMDAESNENNQCRVTWDGSAFGVDSGWDNHPVVWVTWYGAAAYCNWRSGMAGRTMCYDWDTWECNFSANGYRLPTEAEWEKAARGSTDERTYPWGEGIDCTRCNYSPDIDLCIYYTAAVDDPTYADDVSPYGAWQMAGNVWEWCNDWSSDEYYAGSPVNDPTGPVSGAFRVSRGGSWWDGEYHSRCANRGWDSPGDFYDRLGFRMVRRP